MYRLIITLITLALVSPVWAGESVRIEMSPGRSAEEKQAAQTIADSGINQTLVNLSQELFPFSNTLTVHYGGSEGPLYDPAKHTVYIPYTFYLESKGYFTHNGYQERYNKPAQLGAIDTLLHTLLHEAGHAYIEDEQIPVLGKEEDAVDNFATILLLNYVDGGDDAAISAADMFAFESDDKPDYYDFGEYIAEHSFDLQRYFATLCLVYGSDPDSYQNLLDEVEKEYQQERKEYCIDNYAIISDNWHVYLTASQE